MCFSVDNAHISSVHYKVSCCLAVIDWRPFASLTTSFSSVESSSQTISAFLIIIFYSIKIIFINRQRKIENKIVEKREKNKSFGYREIGLFMGTSRNCHFILLLSNERHHIVAESKNWILFKKNHQNSWILENVVQRIWYILKIIKTMNQKLSRTKMVSLNVRSGERNWFRVFFSGSTDDISNDRVDDFGFNWDFHINFNHFRD